MTLKRSSRLLVAHGCSLKQTLLRKVSRRVILKKWYQAPRRKSQNTISNEKFRNLTRRRPEALRRIHIPKSLNPFLDRKKTNYLSLIFQILFIRLILSKIFFVSRA
jgi:hypothetical protein